MSQNRYTPFYLRCSVSTCCIAFLILDDGPYCIFILTSDPNKLNTSEMQIELVSTTSLMHQLIIIMMYLLQIGRMPGSI